MIFVGTFLDQLEESSDTLIKRNKEILNMLPPDIQKLLVYNDLGMNNLIFGVNTISRDDDSLATADGIRFAVEHSISLQVEVPIWWSFLDSLLQGLSSSLKRGVLSKQEYLKLATRFGYVREDLEAALVFFDNVCIAHYTIPPFSPQLDVSSSATGDMCTKSAQQQQSGKHKYCICVCMISRV